MIRFLNVAALLSLISCEKFYDNYRVFRIIPKSNDELQLLSDLEYNSAGCSFWIGPTMRNRPVDLMVAPDYIEEFSEFMNATDMKYVTYVKNVQELIDTENPQPLSEGFGWTSYHTLEEIYDWLDTLAATYPDNIEIVLGGKSYEGRQIKGVRLTFGVGRPGVFIEGGIHAREWISPATVTYLLSQFLTSNDPGIRGLAESHEWYFFPSVNPDGYIYSHTSDRLWRKTRSVTAFTQCRRCPVKYCYGVDANRNWDYKWRRGGASKSPCADTYAGRSPFSEVETRTLSRYISSISDKLYAYITFHSYSQLLLFPYGHTKQHLDNYSELVAMGRTAISAISKKHGTKYRTGSIAETIYIASGNSMDWAKANYKFPITFTYELRDRGKYGFALPANQIIPNGEEVLDSMVALFKHAAKLGYPKRKKRFFYY